MASRAPVGQHLAIGDDVLALLQQRQQVGEVMGQETVVAVEKGDIASAGMVYALVARRRRAAIFLHDDLEARIVDRRSEEHTSELQSLMRISYAVFCLKKKTKNRHTTKYQYHT